MNTKALTVLTGTILSASVAFANAGPCNSSKSNHSDAMMTKASYTAKKDIVDTAVNAGQFNTLVAAVQAAGLVGTLKGDGPYTVFAPTDEAFAALPEGTVESLLLPENKDKLVEILTYHVVPAKVMSADIAGKRAQVLTVEGDRLSVNARNGAWKGTHTDEAEGRLSPHTNRSASHFLRACRECRQTETHMQNMRRVRNGRSGPRVASRFAVRTPIP